LKKTVLIIFITLISASSIFAKADLKLIDTYLKVSGTKEVILSLPFQIEKGYLENVKDKNIDIKSSFDANHTIEYFKIKLAERFDDITLKKIIVFYNLPIGKKFKNSSIDAMSAKNSENKALFYEKLGNNIPSYKRLNILNAFTDRLELSPVAVHLIGELLGSINAQLIASDNSEKIMDSISEQIKDTMFANSLYAYRGFTNKELKSIMGYFYSNTGRYEQKIVSEIFKQFITESFLQIIEQSQQKNANSIISN